MIEVGGNETFGPVPASRGDSGNLVIQAGEHLEKCLGGVEDAARAVLRQLQGLRPDELNLAFGLKATGEAGLFGIAKAGAEANYQVTMTWKRPVETSASAAAPTET